MDEVALHELLSGHRQDFEARMLRGGLHLVSWLYSSVMSARNFGYDREWLRIHRVPVPVISLGNITTGGTGKTPMAAWLANWLTDHGRKPGLLSRGYRSLDQASVNDHGGSSAGQQVGNDEKLVLDRLCAGVPHLQQRDRVVSARRAVTEFGCDILLLDDGFQHRRLHRDLDFVLIDALQPWGYGHVLQRGLLRESLQGLRRADLVILTRANQCTEEQKELLRVELLQIRGIDECVEIAFTPSRLVDPNWQSQSLDSLAGKRAFAFCGIGNPNGFSMTVASLGVECDFTQAFPDHHHYAGADLKVLSQRAREVLADVVLTTQKDLVKISSADWTGPPLYGVEIGAEILSGRELLESHLLTLFDRKCG